MPGRRASFVSGGSDQGIHSLEEAGEQLDVHALKFVIQTKRYSLKLLWLIIFLGGFCLAGYYIYQIIAEWRSTPTATKISNAIHPEYEYPPMFLCNRYNWDLEKARVENLSMDAMVYAAMLTQQPSTYSALPPVSDVTNASDEFVNFLKRRNMGTYADFYKWIALNFSEYVHDSNGLTSDPFQPVFVANPTYHNKPYNNRACWKILPHNYNPNRGEIVSLHYRIERPEVPFGFDDDFLVIKDDSTVVLEKDRLYLRKNRVAIIRLSARRYVRTQSKQFKCRAKNVADSESRAYSQETCRHICHKEAVSKCYVCTVLDDNTPIKVKPINLCSWHGHPDRSLRDCFLKDIERTYNACLTACEPLCEYYAYDFSLALGVLNQSNYNDTRVSLWIYYLVDDGILVYESVPTYTFESMISNIGGQLGLWTGASVLTVLEAAYLMLQFFCADWKVRKKERRLRSRSAKRSAPEDRKMSIVDEEHGEDAHMLTPVVEEVKQEEQQQTPEGKAQDEGQKMEEKAPGKENVEGVQEDIETGNDTETEYIDTEPPVAIVIETDETKTVKPAEKA